MSEFKFTCPVCSQHITADHNASGTTIECPTCFQKLIVPTPPASEDAAKFILTAARAERPRAATTKLPEVGPVAPPPARKSWIGPTILILILAAGGAILFAKRAEVRRFFGSGTTGAGSPVSVAPVSEIQSREPKARVADSPVSVSPAPPTAGKAVIIQYVAAGRNLASAGQIYIHLGWNHWNPVISPDPAMKFNQVSNWWECATTIPANATELNCVFNNGSGTWDNNEGADWNFSVSAKSSPKPQAP